MTGPPVQPVIPPPPTDDDEDGDKTLAWAEMKRALLKEHKVAQAAWDEQVRILIWRIMIWDFAYIPVCVFGYHFIVTPPYVCAQVLEQKKKAEMAEAKRVKPQPRAGAVKTAVAGRAVALVDWLRNR